MGTCEGAGVSWGRVGTCEGAGVSWEGCGSRGKRLRHWGTVRETESESVSCTVNTARALYVPQLTFGQGVETRGVGGRGLQARGVLQSLFLSLHLRPQRSQCVCGVRETMLNGNHSEQYRESWSGLQGVKRVVNRGAHGVKELQVRGRTLQVYTQSSQPHHPGDQSS